MSPVSGRFPSNHRKDFAPPFRLSSYVSRTGSLSVRRGILSKKKSEVLTGFTCYTCTPKAKTGLPPSHNGIQSRQRTVDEDAFISAAGKSPRIVDAPRPPPSLGSEKKNRTGWQATTPRLFLL
ncbi:unnamed protein product, partial [Ectocarpus sp. 6 AP-2014]